MTKIAIKNIFFRQFNSNDWNAYTTHKANYEIKCTKWTSWTSVWEFFRLNFFFVVILYIEIEL